jgi:unsaturated rhamnogalacturonyl hydrolase
MMQFLNRISFKYTCILFLYGILFPQLNGQVHVALDNWFNHETNAKSGLPFHYLWTDTAESGYSRWGEIFKSRGATITQTGKPDAKTLSGADIYIVVDPDSIVETPQPNFIMPEDIRVITKWVKKGGVLVIMANDGNHCGLTHLNYLSSQFGMVFNHDMLRPVVNNQYEMGAFTKFTDHPVFRNLKKIYLKEVASMDLFEKAKPVLTDEGKVIMAECEYGKGHVFAVGDPWIYNEYMDHDRLPADFENRKAAENLTDYLISKTQ